MYNKNNEIDLSFDKEMEQEVNANGEIGDEECTEEENDGPILCAETG